jgi:hypothetical protein
MAAAVDQLRAPTTSVPRFPTRPTASRRRFSSLQPVHRPVGHFWGLLRVRLAVHLKALACNVKRMVNYLVERGRKAAKAAAAAAEGAEVAADAASCVILHLLGRGEVDMAVPVAHWRQHRAGWRDSSRTAAA